MKYVSLLLLLVSLQTQAFLDPKERPQDIQGAVEEAFQEISRHSKSDWRSNGSWGYDICHAPEENVLPSVIRNAPPEQKEFCFLDIGAGNFSWGQNTLRILRTLDLQGKTVHVISVRGEQNELTEKKSLGNIHLYELGGVKVENIADALQQRLGFDCRSKMDVIVSHWTLQHLVDPMGTTIDSYSLLRPGSGKMFFNAFSFVLESFADTASQQAKDPDWRNSMRSLPFLLDQAKVPFLRCHCYGCQMMGSQPHYILHRPSEKPMELSLKYGKIIEIKEMSQISCQKVLQLIPTAAQEWPSLALDCKSETQLIGNDRKLFEWFKTVEFGGSDNPYAPYNEKTFMDITQKKGLSL